MLSNNRIFFRIFKTMFISIVSLTIVFAIYSIQNQKKEIIQSFSLEAKNLAKMISYSTSDAVVLDDGAYLIDFSTEFLTENRKIKDLIFSKTDNNYYLIEEKKWTYQKNLSKELSLLQKDEINYKILKSFEASTEVFRYVYPIVFSGTKWGWLHLGISLDEYNDRIKTMYIEFITFFIGMFFMTFFIAYLIARKLSNPIVKLNSIANQISQGSLDLRSDYKSNDELGELSNSFNEMISKIQFSQKELKLSHEKLEERVNDRTQELYKVNEVLKEKTSELEELNMNLDIKIKKEVNKRSKNEALLIQQSRLAAMGEMIGNIAHQWRQPLSIISTASSGMKLEKEIGISTNESEIEKLDLIGKTVNFLSDTIDDFSNFFKPNKEKVNFLIEEKVNQTLELLNASLNFHYIRIEKNIKDKNEVNGFPNEFSQAVLNIINNAKDILVQKKVKNPKIIIKIYHENEYGILEISDNGGGINEKVIEKIFDPYFTTKHPSQGTGIGLYMSKMIIEQNMNGSLCCKNGPLGAIFRITIPMLKVEDTLR